VVPPRPGEDRDDGDLPMGWLDLHAPADGERGREMAKVVQLRRAE
jgi:hypothetical protein